MQEVEHVVLEQYKRIWSLLDVMCLETRNCIIFKIVIIFKSSVVPEKIIDSIQKNLSNLLSKALQ